MSNYYFGNFIPGRSVLMLSYRFGDVEMQMQDEIPDIFISDKPETPDDLIYWNEQRLVDSQDTWNKATVLFELIENNENEISKLLEQIKSMENEKRIWEREIRDIWYGLPSEPSAKSVYTGGK